MGRAGVYSMWMKRINFLVIVFTFLALIVSPVDATITVTVTAPSSVTQGSNVPIIASFVTGESGDSGTFYLTCDQTASGEVNPEGGYNIMSSTTKTYTFTPNTAQTYSNCKVTDGGSQYSSSFAINVVAPSTLTVTGSPSSTTKNASSTFTLSISITNPTASAITTSYSLSCPSGYTCSGDPTSNTISISAGATTNLQWTITVGSSSADISFRLGSNSNAFTSSVTVSTTTTTTTVSGGGGGAANGNVTTTIATTTTTTVPGVTTTTVPGETTTIAVTTTTTVPSEKLPEIIKRRLPLIIGIMTIVLVGVGLYLWKTGEPDKFGKLKDKWIKIKEKK